MNSSSPEVSVIIPSHNHAPFIQEAIDSVLAQTFRDVEIIVIDDGSTDDTRQKLKPYMDAGRIKCLFQQNLGPSTARNAGLKLARGRYIKFLDSDDFLYPEQIERQLKDIQMEPDAISMTDAAILKLDGRLENRPVHLVIRENQLASFIESNRGVIHAYLVPKYMLDGVGGFDESLNCSEDTDLWIRILETGAYMKHLPMIGCCYRMLKQGLSDDTENIFVQKSKIYEKLNHNFMAQNLTNSFLIDCLVTVNTKLLEECVARKMDPRLKLPDTMDNTERLYHCRLRGPLSLLYKILGVWNYLQLRYLFRLMTRKDYHYNLLYHNYKWRY